MLDINYNGMAMSAARYLGLSYGELSKSVNRLSSGLRIISAADDAAGLAVRELIRADVAALGQGKRNAVDGVSLLQTAEAGLGQMDELLIRMRELAEQASTGTYTDQQKLVIQAEFNSLGDEINRISEQMDFNGINMLNNSDATRISIGAGPNTRGQFIEVQSRNMSAATLMIGGQESFVENDTDHAVQTQDTNFIDFGTNAAGQAAVRFTFGGGTYVGFGPTVGTTQLVTVTSMSISLDNGTAANTMSTTANSVIFHLGTGAVVTLAQAVSYINSAASQYATSTSQVQFSNWEPASAYYNASNRRYYLDVANSVNGNWDVDGSGIGQIGQVSLGTSGAVTSSGDSYIQFGTTAVYASASGTGSVTFTFAAGSYIHVAESATGVATTQAITYSSMSVVLDNGTNVGGHVGADGIIVWSVGDGTAIATLTLDQVVGAVNSAAASYANVYTAYAGITEVNGGSGPASVALTSTGQYTLDISHMSDGANVTGTILATGTQLVTMVASTEALTNGMFMTTSGAYSSITWVQSASGLTGTGLAMGSDWLETRGEGVTLDLVNYVCPAVTAIDTAINIKDSYRAYLGYMMNRLTSVADTLDVQSLQLQDAEARISDVDVATETANMTRNSVLAQAGIAMLSTANGLPQMALSLLGGG